MFDVLFRWLFELSPVVYAQGELRFAPWSGSYVAAAVVAAAAGLVVWHYRTGRGPVRVRAGLTAVRLVLLVVLLACLFRPVLVVRAAVPRQNVVAVVLDDSRSMQIADEGGEPRLAAVRREFGDAGRGALKALADRFAVRVFRFSRTPARVTSEGDLGFAGTETRIGAALSGVRQELAGLPVAGLVLVSDGADTADTALDESLLGLAADQVPVFTVGVGRETLPRDIQVGPVVLPRTVLKGSTVVTAVVLTQSGFDGRTATLDVEDEGRLVSSQSITLPRQGAPASFPVRFTLAEAGPRVLRVRVSPLDGELVAENNARDLLVDVRDRREKILYFEGEPRFELKFIRRAVADDGNLQVVVLQRTADNKYLRLDVDSPDDLVAGFPKTREELFAYRGLILGSIEAGAFSGDQLRMIADFVDRRGGGLLVLGGPRALVEGGWAGTTVADVLPVVLDRGQVQAKDTVARVTVRPTRAGAATPVTQVAPTEEESARRWDTLPPVTVANRADQIKPGATALLVGTDESRRERPVLAVQRYGRGKALAFLVQDSWMWQMHASIPVDDMTHEHYWRQLLRWLVDGVPDQVEPRLSTERVEPGEPAEVMADVADGAFLDLNDATVTARVTAPDGARADVPLTWDGEEAGEYRAVVATRLPGWYEARVEAVRGGRTIGAAVTHFRAAPGDAEFFDAARRTATLRRIADETGGRAYSIDAMDALADDLRYTGRGVTTIEEHDLWHLPAVLLVVIGLLTAEWGYRRAVGLA